MKKNIKTFIIIKNNINNPIQKGKARGKKIQEPWENDTNKETWIMRSPLASLSANHQKQRKPREYSWQREWELIDDAKVLKWGEEKV